MATLSKTGHVAIASICAVVVAACAGSPNTDPFEVGGDSGSGVKAGNLAEASASPNEAGAESDASASMTSADPDASTPPNTSNPQEPPDADQTGSPPASGGGIEASTGGGVDGGCVVNLNCMLAAPPTTGDIRQDCVNRVNQFRTTCACMKPLARWTAGEACADKDAQYDAMMNSAHAGAKANICDWGQAQDECPGYANNAQVISVCLQQMWSEGPPPAGTTIQQCEDPAMINTCYESHGHFINMTNPDMNQIACGFYTTSTGAVWAAQNLSP